MNRHKVAFVLNILLARTHKKEIFIANVATTAVVIPSMMLYYYIQDIKEERDRYKSIYEDSQK